MAGAADHGLERGARGVGWGGEHGEPSGQARGGGRELAVALGRVRVCWHCSERGREEGGKKGGGGGRREKGGR